MAGSTQSGQWSATLPTRTGFYRHRSRADDAGSERLYLVQHARQDERGRNASDLQALELLDLSMTQERQEFQAPADWSGVWDGPYTTEAECRTAACKTPSDRISDGYAPVGHLPRWYDLSHFRHARNEKQSVFWPRLGVGQSAGSRYEQTNSLPLPVGMLLAGFAMGLLNEKMLSDMCLEAKRRAQSKSEQASSHAGGNGPAAAAGSHQQQVENRNERR